MRSKILAAALAFSVPAVAFAQAAPEKLDLDAAVQRALTQTPGLAAARLQKEGADAQADALRGRMLPSVNLSEEYQHYTDKFAFTFGPLGSFTVRAQDTNVFVAAANQPLLGLLHLNEDRDALRSTAEAADQRAQSVESTVREQVTTGFLRYFEAKALVDIAKASEAQLAEQRNIADARMKAGVITNADVLRIETAQANAKLQEVNAQAQADATRSTLLVTLGYPREAGNVDFVEPTALIEAAPGLSEDAAVQQQAESARHEVKAAQAQEDAAHKQEKSKFYGLLPEVNAEAAYVRIHGQPLASPEDKYVGVKASWPIFTWGADYYAYKAAGANSEAAAKQAEDQARNVRIDASQKLAQLKASSSAVELANTAIASAQEAYRVTLVQVKAGVATSTTDLLNAESDLTTARLRLVQAKYERAIAGVALKRATGG